MSLGGELPLGAGLNAQWARLTSSHPLLAPVSRPRWPDILPCPRCSPWVRPHRTKPPHLLHVAGRVRGSVCASPRAAKSKGRPGSMNIMNRAGRGGIPGAHMPPRPPRTPPALKSSLSTPSLTALSHPAHSLVSLFLLRDRDNFSIYLALTVLGRVRSLMCAQPPRDARHLRSLRARCARSHSRVQASAGAHPSSASRA